MTITYNAVYDRIYRAPIQVAMTQVQYGVDCAGLGEKSLELSSMTGKGDDIPAYSVQDDGSVNYLLNYPVFRAGQKYQFTLSAFEDYRYNNSVSGRLDRVAQRGGSEGKRRLTECQSPPSDRRRPLLRRTGDSGTL